MKILFTFLTLTLLTGLACADLFIEETFNYTLSSSDPDADAASGQANGLPATNTGGNPVGTGTGLRNQWAGNVVTGLTFSGLLSSNNAVFVDQSNQVSVPLNPAAYRNMISDPFSSLRNSTNNEGFGSNYDGTLWFSFLISSPVVGDGSAGTTNDNARAAIQFVDHSNINNRVSVGLNPFSQTGAAEQQFGLNGSSATSAATATADTTFLLVGSIDFSTSGNELWSLWVNPTLGGASPGAGADVTLSQEFSGGIGQFSPRFQDGGITGFTIDEFRMGETFGDVTPVPEPSTAGLIGLALLLTSVWRFRCGHGLS